MLLRFATKGCTIRDCFGKGYKELLRLHKESDVPEGLGNTP